jgi:hypothetical protein
LHKKAMFKKLTPEEFDALPIKGWGRSDPTYNAILGMKVGEAIFIPKAGWRSRRKTPSSKCRRIEKKFANLKIKYKCVALADNSGWAVKRLS